MATTPLDAQVLQYVPQRYHLQISTSVFLLSMEGFLSSIVLLFFLPFISTLLVHRSHKPMSSLRKDILFVRVGLLLHALSWLVIGLAPHLVIFILGLGMSALMAGTGASVRSVLTTWVKPDQVGRLYSVLGILETLGLMAAGPMVAQLYNVGLKTGIELWLGLPWIVLGILMTGIVGVFWTVDWTISSSSHVEEPASPISQEI